MPIRRRSLAIGPNRSHPSDSYPVRPAPLAHRRHALKRMAIDDSSLLKQAVGTSCRFGWNLGVPAFA
ncbi:MAG: hypothetical protein ACYC1M_16780 [Armatimonadota bacterium]